MEEETDGKVPFLDVLVENTDNNSFTTKQYHQQTFNRHHFNYNLNDPKHYRYDK